MPRRYRQFIQSFIMDIYIESLQENLLGGDLSPATAKEKCLNPFAALIGYCGMRQYGMGHSGK